MADFTPGPWRANRFSITAAGSTDTYSGTVWGCIAYAEELYDNCDLEGRQWSTSGDREANARLIAASPDLLEALELAEAHLAHCMGEDVEPRATIRAALAKARGQS
jgi:hypothetical protein